MVEGCYSIPEQQQRRRRRRRRCDLDYLCCHELLWRPAAHKSWSSRSDYLCSAHNSGRGGRRAAATVVVVSSHHGISKGLRPSVRADKREKWWIPVLCHSLAAHLCGCTSHYPSGADQQLVHIWYDDPHLPFPADATATVFFLEFERPLLQVIQACSNGSCLGFLSPRSFNPMLHFLVQH